MFTYRRSDTQTSAYNHQFAAAYLMKFRDRLMKSHTGRITCNQQAYLFAHAHVVNIKAAVGICSRLSKAETPQNQLNLM